LSRYDDGLRYADCPARTIVTVEFREVLLLLFKHQ